MTDAHAVAPKRFQQATIRAALKALMPEDGPRRYLVADEAGLGKTIVARGIVEAMSNGLPRPLTVFYVCSNQAIVAQNVQQLAAFLPEDERVCAMAHADRPSLLPLFKHPAHPKLRIYSLTPGTAYSSIADWILASSRAIPTRPAPAGTVAAASSDHGVTPRSAIP